MLKQWARHSGNGYECSSHGDHRFSALHAKLSDGRSIEEAYQLDVKGYRAVSDSWRTGKGKPSLSSLTRQEQWISYLGLWEQWVQENPELLADLMLKSEGKVLTDKFATSDINQAKALATIISERLSLKALPFTF